MSFVYYNPQSSLWLIFDIFVWSLDLQSAWVQFDHSQGYHMRNLDIQYFGLLPRNRWKMCVKFFLLIFCELFSQRFFFFVKSTYFVIDFSRKVIPPTISTKCVLTFQTSHFGNWNNQKTNLAFHGFIQRSFAGWGLKVVFDFLVILVRWDYFGFGK